MSIGVAARHQLLRMWEVPAPSPPEQAGSPMMGFWGEKRDFWDNPPRQTMGWEHALGTETG